MKWIYKAGLTAGIIFVLVGAAMLISQGNSRDARNNPRDIERALLARAYEHSDDIDKNLAKIEYQLGAITRRIASDHGDLSDALSKGPKPALRVLDAETLAPIPDVHVFCSSGPGGYGETDANGMFEVPSGSLGSGTKVRLSHPDYEMQTDEEYELDASHMVTFLMKKGGDASLTVHVTLTVRGRAADSYCSVVLGKADNEYEQVRSGRTNEDGKCRFSGLAPGAYVIRLRFYDDAYLKVERRLQLSRGEHRTVWINAKTEQVALIRVRGSVLDKRNGKALPGVTVQFCGAPDYRATTGKDGTFSTAAHRGYFSQTYFYIGDRMVAYVVMDNDIPEELAKNLQVHVDPDVAVRSERLRDEDRDGVFCDKNGCVICEKR